MCSCVKKISLLLYLLCHLSLLAYGQNSELSVVPLSESEAEVVVAAQEQAKEAAKDAKEVELQSAEIIETAVADLGYKKVIFNRVSNAPSEATLDTSEVKPSERKTLSPEEIEAMMATYAELESKPLINITLSGQVDENGISELWWDYEGARHRIFTNADFLLFTGLGDSFENEENRFSVFMMVSQDYSLHQQDEDWRPCLDDFTPNMLEYFIMEWGDAPEPNAEAFAAIEAMLMHYSANSAEMRTAYDNRRKIESARKVYLEANPPKERDVIINFRPTGKSSELYRQ